MVVHARILWEWLSYASSLLKRKRDKAIFIQKSIDCHSLGCNVYTLACHYVTKKYFFEGDFENQKIFIFSLKKTRKNKKFVGLRLFEQI